VCLVIALILAALSVNAFMSENIALGAMTAFGALFFALLMLRNILKVIRRKKEDHDH